jgi:hypothetical protein
MDHLSGYAHRLPSFVLRYLRQRRGSHVIIVACVMAAVACSVGIQYGVKHPVDGLSGGPVRADAVWLACRSRMFDREGQFPVADRQPDSELCIRRGEMSRLAQHAA